jgi:hypothetical protein
MVRAYGLIGIDRLFEGEGLTKMNFECAGFD